MNRYLRVAAIVAAALTVVFVGDASARWTTAYDIPWKRQHWSNTGPYLNTSALGQDSLYTSIAASKVDSSDVFNLLDADQQPITINGISPTTSDSVACAYVAITSDSCLAAIFKATTCAIQANWSAGTQGANSTLGQYGWRTIATYTCSETDSTRTWVIPINSTCVKGVGSMMGKDGVQRNWMYAPSLRLIVTGGSSAVVPAARIRAIEYKANSSGGATTNY